MRVFRFLALVVTVLVAIAACHPPSPYPPPSPDADAATPPIDASCDTWCAHAAELRCDAAKPTPAGAACVDVCRNFDGPLQLDVACRTSAATCAAADECENGKLAVHASATCAAWCRHAAALKCPAAKATPAGASCEQVCANANSGSLKWNLRCRLGAKTCAAADDCESR